MKKIINNLTFKEKLKLLIGKDVWSNSSCNGKVYTFVVSDGPIGLRHPDKTTDNEKVIPSIAYPSAQVLSQTWNIDLAKKLGNALANDCIEMNVDILLGPGVNIKRMPINGRNFEYLSEDPFVSGLFAREYIKGIQEKHVGTSLKHYCCNNIEYSRLWASSEVDERTLREIYLKPFEIACQAKPWTVMSSYNLVNGERMSEHKKLYTVLRKELGFDGLIVSDWGAVKDRVKSLKAGLDLEMPFDQTHLDALNQAAEDGTLPLDKVDESVERVVELAEKCRVASTIRKVDMTVEQREQVAMEIQREGIVLLKNNGVLPLSTDKKVFVTGAPARKYYYGGGSSEVTLRNPFVPLEDVLKEYIPQTTYHESCWEVFHGQANMGNLKAAKGCAVQNEVSIVCVGNENRTECEGYDRQHIKLCNEEIDVIKNIVKISLKTVVVVFGGSAIDMADWIDDVDAVLYVGFGGDYSYQVLSEILVGKINPSGKLTETFPLKLEDVPSMNCYRDGSCFVYSDGLNVGYRYFNTFEKPVLFPFGYGLSYSKYAYSNLHVTGSGTDFTLSFDIENLSDVDGKEVAQVYVRDLANEVYRPNKELKAFKKVFVPANQKVRVEISLDKEAFAYYSTAIDSWKVHNGVYEIQVCSDVETIHALARIEVEC